MQQASQEMEGYFTYIDTKLSACLKVASKARELGKDPENKVDIPLASDMAERVEGLISTIAPQLKDSPMAKRIKELEKKYDKQSWEVALLIAEEVAKEKFCKFKDKKEAMEVGIRVGMAYSTAGIVAAPLEGLVDVKIKQRKDGKDYLAAYYAGPIRGAGGTAAAVSVIITDYVRVKCGFEKYDPTPEEVKRFCREVLDYHERVTNLQYLPSQQELEFLAKHIPVEITGDPTEKIEVSNYKDLQRVETNLIRGGMCLVLAEGVAQKAPKLWKRLSIWGESRDIDWGFLKEFISLQKKIKAKQKSETKDGQKITPNYTYIADLVAGRPVLSYPLREGGFRLRYGRTRMSGYSAAAINPATMWLLNKYIAVGTQLKVERPGKAASVTACDEIDGPIVKLRDGTVIKIDTEEDAKKHRKEIEKILFLGDMLFNYGDFSENNHNLIPSGYCPEWWVLEVEKSMVELFGTIDSDKLSELVHISNEDLNEVFKHPKQTKISPRAAFSLSKKLKVPFHPDYTYFWRLIKPHEIAIILEHIEKAKVVMENDKIKKSIFRVNLTLKSILERIGLPHLVVNDEFIVISANNTEALFITLGVTDRENIREVKKKVLSSENKSTNEILEEISGIKLRDKAGTFIGARMGRPEKAKMRKLTGSPHVLFPVGEEGGRMRSFQAAIIKKKIRAELPIYVTEDGKTETIYPYDPATGEKTRRMFYSERIGIVDEQDAKADKYAKSYRNKEIDIKAFFELAVKELKISVLPDMIKGVRGTSNKDHIPENLAKGILRAKHGIAVNKDGTTRYDMTELPITHFTPAEIRVSISKLQELGYTKDINGRPLSDEDQTVELRPQDIILPSNEEAVEDSADKVLFRTANFIDDLLVNFYGQKPFYKLSSPSELIGHLVIGLAPHISAGTVGRIVGFSKTQGCFAHPLWHAALRRDCDGDECCVMLVLDAFLNFSRQFLPDKRGSRTMDSPLVLTSRLIPSEVDDMAHGVDVVWKYPLEFYEAAMEYKKPWEVQIEQIKKRLNSVGQYENMGFTHEVKSINQGVLISAYKTLPTMEEKLKGQMDLAEKISAVEACDVASAVIRKHFLKDIKGNLRKFSQQQFRCVECNEKFRRPPLSGRCTKCTGKIIFTISEGSVGKYLEPSLSLAKKYNVPAYLQQTLELTKRSFEGVFGKDKDKQASLGDWFGG